MSINTLKRKSRHNPRFAPISGRGADGFSLNGGYRNHGGIGQFRLIGNTTMTPFRGTQPIGWGGTLGQYYNNPQNSGSCITNNNAIIKKSSLNTKGQISTQYKWIKGQYPNYWVQEDDNFNNRISSVYTTNLTKKFGSLWFTNLQNNGNCGTLGSGKTLLENALEEGASNCGTNLVDAQQLKGMSGSCNGGVACSYYIGTRKFIRKPYAKNLNQPAKSQGQYISTGGVSKKNCLPTPPNKQPFPMALNHITSQRHETKVSGTSQKTDSQASIGCQINYNTWQEAQAAGALPPDWTPGGTINGVNNFPGYIQRSGNFANAPDSAFIPSLPKPPIPST